MARKRKRKNAKRYKFGKKYMTARQLRCRFGKRRARSIMGRRKGRKGRKGRRR